MQIVTLSELRSHLKEIMSATYDEHEPVVVKRPRGENMVLLSLRDYESLKETAYLLSTEANAKHLRKSLQSVQEKKLTEKKLKDLPE